MSGDHASQDDDEAGAAREGSVGEPAGADLAAAGADSGERQAELEELFRRWDQRADAERAAAEALAEPEFGRAARSSFDPLRMRVAFATIITLLAAVLMWNLRHEFLYWATAGDEPMQLGDLSERFKAGQRSLDVPSNSWVTVSGMASTYEAVRETEEGEKARHYFLDPFFDVVVYTEQPFPEKPERNLRSLMIDEAFIELLENRRAFPIDLQVFFSGSGRLMLATEAPRWAAAPVSYYSRQLGLDPRATWVFIDGETPQSNRALAALWMLAPLAPLMSMLAAWRTWRRRRRELDGGHPETGGHR